MGFTRADFEAILDTKKDVHGDIEWQEDQDHSLNREFRASVESEAGHVLTVVGGYNPRIPAVSYSLIYPQVGRIYGLCLGKDHHNPSCTRVGETHKHHWTAPYRDGEAYVPDDVSASPGDPLRAWEQFCTEARIEHHGRMHPPRSEQEVLPL